MSVAFGYLYGFVLSLCSPYLRAITRQAGDGGGGGGDGGGPQTAYLRRANMLIEIASRGGRERAKPNKLVCLDRNTDNNVSV